MLRTLLALAALFTLSGCATVVPIPPNPLTLEARLGVHVEAVAMAWRVDEKQAEPDAIKQAMMKGLKESAEDYFKREPTGPEAVRLEIDVKRFQHNHNSLVAADVRVVRASDGMVLATYANIQAVSLGEVALIPVIFDVLRRRNVLAELANSFGANLRLRFDGA